MGKFDGYLICTDYDGTFATKGEPVEKNIPAIRYFTENGGYFTIATGRSVDFIREKGLDTLINAPACLYNGSLVYDYGANKILRTRYLPFTVAEFFDLIKPLLPRVENIDLYEDVGTWIHQPLGDITGFHLQEKQRKLLCRFATEAEADAFRAAAEMLLPPGLCSLSKSWAFGVEFNPVDGTKGHALDFVKSYLPGVHTTIGVGNYDNDLSLLRHADISAAPDGSQESVLAAAKLHLRPCADGAIADLIDRLHP